MFDYCLVHDGEELGTIELIIMMIGLPTFVNPQLT